MRFLILLLLVLPATTQAHSQDFNDQYRTTMSRGMTSLLGWSAANLVSGSIGALTTDGKARYFHQMNAGWNVVNAGLALAGLRKYHWSEPRILSTDDLIRDFTKVQRVFFVNTLFDIGYMAGGLYMRNWGVTQRNPRFQGYGESLILQGAYLFAFDLVMYLVIKSRNRQVYDSLTVITPSENGLGIALHFW